jgi:hypothetical protein
MTTSKRNSYDPNKPPKRLDYWSLIDRVACSGDVSPTAIVVLMRLLQHRNTETGQCNPSIALLAQRLFPKLAARSAYDKVEKAIRELKRAGIIHVIQRYNATSIYRFAFSWGLATHPRGEINTSLQNVRGRQNNVIQQSDDAIAEHDDTETTLSDDASSTSSDDAGTAELNNKGNNKGNDKEETASSFKWMFDVGEHIVPGDDDWKLQHEKRLREAQAFAAAYNSSIRA